MAGNALGVENRGNDIAVDSWSIGSCGSAAPRQTEEKKSAPIKRDVSEVFFGDHWNSKKLSLFRYGLESAKVCSVKLRSICEYIQNTLICARRPRVLAVSYIMENDLPPSQPAQTFNSSEESAGAPCCCRGWVVFGTICSCLIAIAVIALPFAWPGPDGAKLNPWTEYFGTLHPLVLHLPIGIVILVITMEVLGWLSFGRYKPQTTLALGIGLLSAVAAVSLGYLLFMTGDYGKGDLDRDIGRHLWGTIAFTALLAAAFAAKIWNTYDGRRSVLYGVLLMASAGALTLGAHKGAVITHGSDPLEGFLHLVNPLEKPAQDEGVTLPPVGEEDGQPATGDLLAYEQVIVPLLSRYCYECHSEAGINPVHAAGKVKGKLSMASIESLEKGGSSDEPALVPGDSEQSFMLEVMRYELDDEEHMPPEDSP
ncbi:MAG: putative membrane protein, partial [Verrucomicrobiales bacterium]